MPGLSTISWRPTDRAGAARSSTSAPGRHGSRSPWPQADSQARVLALDLSETMLAQAEVNIAAAGLTSRIRTHQGDAKALLDSFGQGIFEGVISNTIIHHIPDPLPALETMARLVAPRRHADGAETSPAPARWTISGGWPITYAAGESPEARALFEASLNAALTLEEIRVTDRRPGLSAA